MSELLLKGKTALVTGGSRGIGRAIALAFAREGAEVAIADYGDDAVAAEAVALLREAGSDKAFSLKGDVSDPEFAKACAAQMKDVFGGCDILVNNAGITDDGLLLRMKPESFDRVVRINLNGAFYMTKEISALMVKARAGRILNMSSVSGVKGNAGQANYSSSKAGLIGLTLSTAKELGARGITANAIAPGFINTPMTALLTEEQMARSVAAIALGRAGEPEDIANLAVFLASDLAAYITGQVIAVDGGLVL
ncbi:MAG: 3-oxoacyl-[acyl-carrier-protein] reductase [Clostridiales Family XIII bacterium]|jgi:3-oxoacyl-[acyl-carrier protein] reductase|nr:3-oxoacyl-[acyl-carrier-protein] reductase [Clostridiales Family XIII bacterium]